MRPKIKNHHKGRVGNDGNGMVGGRWENTTRLAYKDISVERLTECISDAEKAKKCLLWLKEKIGESFRLEAYFDEGYDYSVGLDSYCDMNESLDPDQVVLDAINTCPSLTPDEKDEMKGYLFDICDDEDGYEFYEID